MHCWRRSARRVSRPRNCAASRGRCATSREDRGFLLAAAVGVRVVKHGNRSVSSRSGSADLLECLGLPLPLEEARAGDCLAATGFTFLFAPHYHPAMKNVAPVRRALGVRTVFNMLGPLTNPAEPPFKKKYISSVCAM